MGIRVTTVLPAHDRTVHDALIRFNNLGECVGMIAVDGVPLPEPAPLRPADVAVLLQFPEKFTVEEVADTEGPAEVEPETEVVVDEDPVDAPIPSGTRPTGPDDPRLKPLPVLRKYPKAQLVKYVEKFGWRTSADAPLTRPELLELVEGESLYCAS